MATKNELLISLFTRNRPKALAVTLMSLWCQNYRDFDILIVDDASTPQVREDKFVRIICTRLKQEGITIEFVRSNSNRGISKNRAAVLNKLKEYEFVFDLNDDHFLEPNCLELLMKTIKGTDACVVGSATPIFYAPNKELYHKLPDRPINIVFVDDEGALKLSRDVDFIYADIKGELLEEPIEVSHASQFVYRPEYVDELPEYSVLGFTEETELSMRCKRNSGKPILFVPNAINWHMQAPSGGVREGKNMAKWEEMKAADWKIFNSNWYDWVKEHQKEWL